MPAKELVQQWIGDAEHASKRTARAASDPEDAVNKAWDETIAHSADVVKSVEDRGTCMGKLGMRFLRHLYPR